MKTKCVWTVCLQHLYLFQHCFWIKESKGQGAELLCTESTHTDHCESLQILRWCETMSVILLCFAANLQSVKLCLNELDLLPFFLPLSFESSVPPISLPTSRGNRKRSVSFFALDNDFIVTSGTTISPSLTDILQSRSGWYSATWNSRSNHLSQWRWGLHFSIHLFLLNVQQKVPSPHIL